jgi:hypothetical protein
VGRDCSEPNPVARTSTESRLPARREYEFGAVNGTASLTSKPILVHSAAHTGATRFGQRPAPSLRLLGLGRMQPATRQRGSVQPVGACAVRSGIVHRWHSVATQCMWLQHIALRHTSVCCADVHTEADVPAPGQQWWRRCRRGTDSAAVQMAVWAGDAMDSFAVQRWARDRLSPVANVGGGWTVAWSRRPRCRGGRAIPLCRR